MIKAVIFDIGDVVVKVSEQVKFNKLLGIKGRAISKKIYKKLSYGKISSNEVYRIIAKKYGKAISEIKAAYLKAIHARKLMKGMPNLLDKLKKNYVLATITNTTKASARLHRMKNHYKWFEYKFISCDMGCAKPEKRIFIIALKEMKMKPNECVFVDDRKNNLVTARKLGMKVILFKSTKQLIRDLKKKGVKI